MTPTVHPMPVATPLLELRDLAVRFESPNRSVQAVGGLSYRLLSGRTLAIVGESGSGKTVSCRALMGLLPPTAVITGSARLDGKELLGLREHEMRRHRGADIAMIFQDPTRSLNPTMRVGYQITEALRLHAPLDREGARRRAIELLDQLRVPGAKERFLAYPHELSGGLKQRVMIAIAIAGKPRLLIADEATRCLDPITQEETLLLLKDLQRHYGMALILISHDLRLAENATDEVLVMYAGRAVEYAPTRKAFGHPRMHYTKSLIDSIPGFKRAAHTYFAVPPGQPPDLTALPCGCAFEPRCSSAQARCASARPTLEQQEPGHWAACWHPREATTSI
jgi:oligopeptide/dipeptide ABC transporter ATP-binding protein